VVFMLAYFTMIVQCITFFDSNALLFVKAVHFEVCNLFLLPSLH
jgi:hypothetical protein